MLLGLYSYGIFVLGILGRLYKVDVVVLTILVSSIGIFYIRKKLKMRFLTRFEMTPFLWLPIVFLASLGIINLIGVFGPEISFDALWYHLTLPKLFLQDHSIHFIPGGLLYYSVMPKLGEMFFIPALIFNDEVYAKVIQFIFGILTTVAIYKISRRYVSLSLSLLASLVFYSNIVVAWESTVAYIDLIRAFYEVMGLWALLLWVDTQKRAWLYVSAVMIGFAIATKVLAFGSLVVFTFLIFFVLFREKNFTLKTITTTIFVYWYISIFIVLPWFLFSYFTTGNPLYPFFTNLYPVTPTQSLHYLLRDVITLFLFADDPISPIYVIILPLVIVYFSTLKQPLRLIGYYSLGALVIWYLTPHTGGGRFILPYLPAWSVLVIGILDVVKKQQIIYKSIVITIFCISFGTIVYRGIANNRYIPVILGQETKSEFLSNHLNFAYGDFYDVDGNLAKQIKPSDKVLLFGFHNLFYIDFPFVDSSWIEKGQRFNYIATQHTDLPKRFKDWDKVYENTRTGVKLYNKNRMIWTY